MTKQTMLDQQAHHDPGLRGQHASSLALPGRQALRWRAAARAAATTDRLLLMLVLASGAALRLWQLNSLGFNSDEAVYTSQAAVIAQDPRLRELFPLFRAHPMLFQFVLALGFSFGVSDLVGRLIVVAVGVLTIYLVFRLGKLLYGAQVGLLAALFISVMPYHVIVTRQVLLDGPMTLCATLTLYLMARFATTQQRPWLYAAGVGMGLTFLTKETGIVLLGAIYVFLALAPEVRIRLRDLALSTLTMAAVIAAFPLTLLLAGNGAGKTTQSYLIWQLFRRPNHEWSFYFSVLPAALGPLLLLAALLGLVLRRREGSWREKLLLSWIAVPTLFFILWPVKGFQYLLPAAIPVAVLGARALAPSGPLVIRGWSLKTRWLRGGAGLLIALSLLWATRARLAAEVSTQFLAGAGGIPGGREAGLWVRDNVPEGAQLLTVGPSMANILQFYGYRRAYGLSVSPNPLHRNPSYQPIYNPDFQIREGELQYLVWDSFSSARSSFFSAKLLWYVKRYNGRLIHSESISVAAPDGTTQLMPVIQIYEVRP